MVLLLALAAPQPATAYGPEGHLIAGRAAATLLCARAAAEIGRLGSGEDLGTLGLWADRVRSEPAYADTGPWHYLNIDDGASLARYRTPPEGDILEALERFRRRVGDRGLDDAQRGEALRFLVHFIVDLHQPLHVGRAEDRGGNRIELRFRGEETNLHRLWDSDAIAWRQLSLADYAAAVSRRAVGLEGGAELDPRVWAAEAMALRATVYAFGASGREPPAAYLDQAAAITEARLSLAAARLAGTLNALFCD